jgi:hypothetical protein
MMTEKRLMFEENGRYLSLAVPVNPKRVDPKAAVKQ